MYYVIYSVEVLELFFNKLNTAVRAWVVVYLEIATSEFCKSVSFLLHEELVHGLGKRPEYFLRQFPMLHFSRIRRAHDASESILRLFSKSFCTIWKLSEHKSLEIIIEYRCFYPLWSLQMQRQMRLADK